MDMSVLVIFAVIGVVYYFVRLGRKAKARDTERVRVAGGPRAITKTITITSDGLADARRRREDDWKQRAEFRKLPIGERGEGTVHRGKPLGMWISQLGERSLYSRTEAANALQEIGLPAYAALPALWEQAKHREREVAESAVRAIQAITTDKDEWRRACDLEERRWYR